LADTQAFQNEKHGLGPTVAGPGVQHFVLHFNHAGGILPDTPDTKNIKQSRKADFPMPVRDHHT